MKVNVKKTKDRPLERRLNISFQPENLESLIANRLSRLQKKVKMPGFRPGKIPLSIMQKQYGGEVTAEIIEQQMNDCYRKALEKENITPTDVASFEEVDMSNPENVSFTAVIEVFPEVKLSALSKIKINRQQCDVTDKAIDDTLEKIRTSRVEWQRVDRASATGDQVVVDFAGEIDGELFEGGTAQEVPIELGSGKMIPGFEEALINTSAEEEKSFTVTFPDDYQAPHLAGKEAVFKSTIRAVSEKKLPELNDAFAESLGIKDGTLASLRADVEKRLAVDIEHRLYQKNRETAINTLLDKHEFSVPQSLVNREVGSMIAQIQNRQKMYGVAVTDRETLMNDDLTNTAVKRIRSGLLLQSIMKEYNIELDEALLQEEIEMQIASAPEPEKAKQHFNTNQAVRTDLENAVLEKQLITLVFENCKVVEESVDLDTILSEQNQ